VELPRSPVARKAAEALVADFSALGTGGREGSVESSVERRKAYRAACLRWHPDKNLDDEDTATEVFQFLQLLKEWCLGA